MINSLGEGSTAAHTIANTVESAFYIPGYGMQTAAATLAGNAYGANDEKRGCADDAHSSSRHCNKYTEKLYGFSWINEKIV